MLGKPVISFEALTFFTVTLVVLLRIIESLDYSNSSYRGTKEFANFIIGTSLTIFGLMLAFRIFFGTAILRGDVGVPKNIEVFCLCLAFLFSVLAVMTIVVSIDQRSGFFVWVSGSLAAILIGYANVVKYKEVTDVLTPSRSEAQVVPVPVAVVNARENARPSARRDSFSHRTCEHCKH